MRNRLLSAAALLAAFSWSASGQTGSLERDMLAAHNAVRERLKLKPLVWSEDVAAWAQQWADTLLAEGRFEHRPRNPYGENLFLITNTSYLPIQVVNEWAGEVRFYDHRSNKCTGMCGHYTQIVWKSTRELGCGVARTRASEVWVCNYNPRGNIVGERPY